VHFFTFNIGDWNKKTGHLSFVEEFVYFKLVCFCYETELPIPTDTGPVIRKLRLQKHAQIVDAVLAEFFTPSPEGWTNKRVFEELETIYKKSGKARESAQERWRLYRLKLQGNSHANAMRTHTERNANAMLEPCESYATQDTINPIPNTQDTNNTRHNSALHAQFSEFWQSWPSGFGDKGSKKNAEREFLKIKPDKELLAVIVRAVEAQFRDKQQRAQTGQFCPPFKHVERWLKNREWENEIQHQRPTEPSRIQSIESALDQAFGYAGSEEGILEGDFQTINQYGSDEQAYP